MFLSMFMKQNLTIFFPIEHFDYFNAISRYLSISRNNEMDKYFDHLEKESDNISLCKVYWFS